MILEMKGAIIVVAVPVAAAAVIAAVQGVVLSPELLVGIGANFVTLVFIGAKVLADGRSQKAFHEKMKDVPETLIRLEGQIQMIDRWVEDQKADQKEEFRERRRRQGRQEDL